MKTVAILYTFPALANWWKANVASRPIVASKSRRLTKPAAKAKTKVGV